MFLANNYDQKLYTCVGKGYVLQGMLRGSQTVKSKAKYKLSFSDAPCYPI